VTIGRETFQVPNPFLVLATQNPIETEGTYPLPEAQVDRFMLKVLVDYPNRTEEFVIVERMTGALQAVQKVLSTDQLIALQKKTDQVFVDPALMEYAVNLVTATRKPSGFGSHEPRPDQGRDVTKGRPDKGKESHDGAGNHGLGKELEHYILYGASPRASINLILTARALAFVRGRDYVLPQDILDMALDVMRHRLVLSYEALSDNVTSDDLLKMILEHIPVPVVPLHEHTHIHDNA
jgi:MoxR-like ATPase